MLTIQELQNWKRRTRTNSSPIKKTDLPFRITSIALQTNKALALAEQLIESLRSQRVIVPTVTMIDRLCAEAPVA